MIQYIKSCCSLVSLDHQFLPHLCFCFCHIIFYCSRFHLCSCLCIHDLVFVETGSKSCANDTKSYKKSRHEATPFQLVNDNGLNESRAIQVLLVTVC